MIKIKTIFLCITLFLLNQISQACDVYLDFCLSATLVNNEKIVVGTISNSLTNSVELTIIDVLFGAENNNVVTIWDGSTIECNGPWPNDANDMGSVGDTILCIIEPITSIENPWDIIGEYRRPSLLGGDTYTNFSIGMVFDFEETYTFNEILALDISNYCCNKLTTSFYMQFTGLPNSTGFNEPISLSGYPEGGTFSGPGIIFSAFNPSIAGPGNHTITYTINDEFGCAFSTEQNILVYSISFNFVNYNLGTISPKLANEVNIAFEVQEPDQYTFLLFDMNGRLIDQQDQQFEVGTYHQNIKLDYQLPKGIYLLKIANSQTYTSKKFVVSG